MKKSVILCVFTVLSIAFFISCEVLESVGIDLGGEEDTTPTGPIMPTWQIQPMATSSIEGQFTLKKGVAAAGSTAPVIAYYYAISGTPVPGGNVQKNWEDFGWKKIENPEKPVLFLETPGTWYIYGVANSGNFYRRSIPAEVQVESSLPPREWTNLPSITGIALKGIVDVTEGVAVHETDGGTPPVITNPVPPVEYSYYYAAYQKDNLGNELIPIPPTGNRPSDWRNAGWKKLHEPGSEKLNFAKYLFYAVAENNGGSIRHPLGDVTLGGPPDWPELPTTSNSQEGAFTLLTSGIPGGYPVVTPNQAVYYFGKPDNVPPDESDWGNPIKWVQQNGWSIVRVGDTRTGISPAATDYQLFAVAENSVGVTARGIDIKITGLTGFTELPDGRMTVKTSFYSLTIQFPQGMEYVTLVNPDLEGVGIAYAPLGIAIVGQYVMVVPQVYFPTKHTWAFDTYAFYDLKNIVNAYFNPSHKTSSLGDYVAIQDGYDVLLFGGQDNDGFTNRVQRITNPYLQLFEPKLSLTQNYDAVSIVMGIHSWRKDIDIDDYPQKAFEIRESPGWLERWSPRANASVVNLDSEFFLMAGEGENNTFYNDVWKTDKRAQNWQRLTKEAPWTPRADAAVTVYDNRIWLAGGRDSSGMPLNDVWSSPDGVNWRLEIISAPWDARYEHSLVVMQNRLWLTAGRSEYIPFSDLWQSADGRTWNRAPSYGTMELDTRVGVHAMDNMLIVRDIPNQIGYFARWIKEG